MAVYLPQTLVRLVELGANVHISNVTYMPQSLAEIVAAAKRTGAHVTIEGNYLPATLEALAKIGGNNLTIIVRKD